MSTVRSSHNTPPSTYRWRRAVAGSVLASVVLATNFVRNEYNEFRADQSQPACDIEAVNGDMVSGLKARLASRGDGGGDVMVFAHQDGHLRSPNDPRDTSRFFVNGSMNLQAGDTVRILGVEPNVCGAIGGTVVSLAAMGASLNLSQK